MFQLQLPEAGLDLSAESLKAVAMPANLPDALQRAADFCRQWLGGAQEFTFHTSGSTGQPKAIQLRREQLEASARATIYELELGPADVFYCPINTGFIGGAMMLVRAMLLDVPVQVRVPSSGAFDGDAAAAATFAAIVPMQMPSLLQAAAEGRVPRLMQVIIGGAGLTASQWRLARQLPMAAWHTFGMTETASHIALRRLNGPDASEAYYPLPGIELKLDDRDCLCICGPVTGNQWLVTNDMVNLRPDGGFIWLGRADFTINSGGVKINPERVEQIVSRYLGSQGHHQTIYISSVPHEVLGETLVLVCDASFTQDALYAFASMPEDLFPAYHKPNQLAGVAQFPQTTGGKVDRVKLKQLINQAR